MGVWFYLPADEEVTVDESEQTAVQQPYVAPSQIETAPPSLPESEKAKYSDEYEEVLGIMVRKDRDCTVSAIPIYEPNGDLSWAYSCTPDNPPEQHRYADISVDDLREMAYNDSEAAEILAIKLLEAGDEEAGLTYVYRAVALESGRSFSAMTRAQNMFYAGIDIRNEQGELVAQLADLEQAYIFSRIRDRLNHEKTRIAELYRRDLDKWGFTEYSRLEAKVDEALKNMAATEIEVVGDNRIQGIIDT